MAASRQPAIVAAVETIWAAPVVLISARRVARLERLGQGTALLQLLEALRRVRRLPRLLARPECLARAATRLLPWLPPRGMGPCLKRSLILLDLWARCGVEARLHLGVAGGAAGGGRGHVWVSAPGFPPESGGGLETWSG